MTKEVTEIAKATQEVAKTTRVGIEAAQGVGRFLARVLGEPVETAAGILSDHLKYVRLERQHRLEERYDQFLLQRGLQDATQRVSAKIAIPAIQNASLEEDDQLQDLWAQLLASASDKRLNGMVRSCFIDIIKQLEVVDVRVLNLVYDKVLSKNVDRTKEWWESDRDPRLEPIRYGIYGRDVQTSLRISTRTYECAADNLFRVRCLAPYQEELEIETEETSEKVSLVHEYGLITITPLGWNFVRSCTSPPVMKGPEETRRKSGGEPVGDPKSAITYGAVGSSRPRQTPPGRTRRPPT